MVKCPVCSETQLAYVQGPTRTSCFYCGTAWVQSGDEQDGIILQDPAHLETLPRPTVPVGPGSTARRRQFTFELESHGGHLRTVSGTIAYLDNEAKTYMVSAADGELLRVPVRDIKRTIETAS